MGRNLANQLRYVSLCGYTVFQNNSKEWEILQYQLRWIAWNNGPACSLAPWGHEDWKSWNFGPEKKSGGCFSRDSQRDSYVISDFFVKKVAQVKTNQPRLILHSFDTVKRMALRENHIFARLGVTKFHKASWQLDLFDISRATLTDSSTSNLLSTGKSWLNEPFLSQKYPEKCH